MPSLSDHVTRDAHAAGYAYMQLELGKYRRRMWERIKAHVAEEREAADNEGREVDGTRLGQAAATRVVADYIGVGNGEPRSAIESSAAED